ncbi:MAG: Uncharacterized protein FD155_2160 [Bacteroidetes bacterium]|nr:MAG: Uncharacterized protein FD155_2160 [Bacteroidota bacterium]
MATNIGSEIGNLTSDLKVYFNLRLNLIGLMLSKRIATLSSFLVTAVLITGLASMVILMLSFAFVFWFGHHVGTYYQGFLLMALIYLLLGLIVYLGRKKFFVDPVIHKINEKIAAGDFTGLGGSMPPGFQTIDDQIKYLVEEVDRCELEMQNDFDSLTDQLQPVNIIKNIFGSMLTSPTLIITVLDLAIRALRRNKKDGTKEEGTSDS